jgi:Glycoside Hydrolase Family 113
MIKKISLILLLLLVAILFIGSQFRRKPKKIELTPFRANRILIQYVPTGYLSANIETLANRLETNLQEAETLLGKRLDKQLNVYLFGNWEEKGNYIDDVRLAHADPAKSAIYCVVNADWDGIAERFEYQVVLQNAHGKPFHPEWEEFSASSMADIWFQKKLDDWEIFLKARDLLPKFPDLFTDEQTSRFVRYPWNASFARFLTREYGLPAMIQHYKTGELPADSLQRWQNKLESIPLAKLEPYVFSARFQKGMTYAYSNGYDAGYATKKSGQSLNELQDLGVEWIASVPYGFMRSNHAQEIHFPGHHIAGENDESLWALAEDAKARRIKIMMKPQIWISHSSWPGKIDFDSSEDWNRWLDNYEKWIVHYAIISELTGADLLCIGTEFVQATLKNPYRWRLIIKKVRKVYHGPLTYAANWGREFEEIPFWDELDYMGLDNYYPVRSSEDQGMSEMKSGFAKQKEKLQNYSLRHCRPLLFTEIGYMANNKAGMGTKEFEADESDYDEQAQAACFRLALETYWNEPWFAGMYWWKWFSDPDDRGRSADTHSPHDRAAQKSIAEWYRKKRP